VSAPTRQTLIREGSLLLRRNGYAASGIVELLERSGVPKGSFYHHFGSKEAFAVEVAEAYYAWHDRRLEALLAETSTPALERIYAYFDVLLERAAEAPSDVRGCLLGLLALETAASGEALPEALHFCFDRWRGRLGGLVAQAQAAGELPATDDPRVLAGLLIDAWEGALIQARLADHVTPLRSCRDIALPRLLGAP